jgi:hypothetical protein
VQFLNAKYPERVWRISRLEDRGVGHPDLVVCADVIEHVLDPDELVEFIHAMNPRYVIFSTPERDLVYSPEDHRRFGPPRNFGHLREWNFQEFRKYISQQFHIIDHMITNRMQCTQMIVCKPRN